MEIKDIQRASRPPKKVSITIRIPEEVSKWMKFKNVSPTLLFERTAKELMEKDKEWQRKEHPTTRIRE